uniref:C2H2-type domain-containing protein n=1 Tax=Vitis vinifera TaxID=29760 RepID=A5BU19_VITVI|nr:hypothetical protein VITISV_005191 [Vitis vinifera]
MRVHKWACAVCQFTTQSEVTFNSHLQGKRHQATSEQLTAKNQATKTNCSPSASKAKKSDQSTKEEQPKCPSNNLNSQNNGISAASTVKKPDETKDDEQQKCASSNGPNQKNNKKQEEKSSLRTSPPLHIMFTQGHSARSRPRGSLRPRCPLKAQVPAQDPMPTKGHSATQGYSAYSRP